MSNICCNIEFDADFSPAVVNWRSLLVGSQYAYGLTFAFKVTDTGDPINITADSFEMRIYNSLGVLVETLTTPTEIVISDTNKLNLIIETPITDTVATYTYVLDWTRALTGEVRPIVRGKISVK